MSRYIRSTSKTKRRTGHPGIKNAQLVDDEIKNSRLEIYRIHAAKGLPIPYMERHDERKP